MIDIKNFRQLALSFGGATEEPHFEKTSFRVNKRIFATLDVNNNRACLMLSENDQSVFCALDQTIIYPVPNKWGAKGATFVELTLVQSNLLKDAIRHAYNNTVTKNKITKNTL